MHENDTVRDLLKAALRKLDESRVEQTAAERSVTTQNAASQPSSQSASHPGLERFTIIEGDPTPLEHKPCYMEPDRSCVKSGACEMRGY